MPTMTREDVQKAIAACDNTVLVDALPEAEYNKGHLPGALSMPLDKLGELAPVLVKDKDRKIITYCAGKECLAAQQAAEMLRNIGYTNVAEYTAGKADWTAAGLSLEGDGNGYAPDGKPDNVEDGQGEASAVSTTFTDDHDNAAPGVEIPDPNGIEHE